MRHYQGDRNVSPVRPGPTLACESHTFVSIVVCTLGVRATLRDCIESLHCLHCANYEVVLVLNGEHRQGVPEWLRQYPLVVLCEPRLGVSCARNAALKVAKGNIVAFVDDDVTVHPEWIHELLKAFRGKNVVCVLGRVKPLASSAIPAAYAAPYLSERVHRSWSEEPGTEGIRNALAGKVPGFGCNMAFAREFLLNYSRFPEDLGAGSLVGSHDEPYMFVQVLRHGFRICYTPTAQVTHFFSEVTTDEWRARVRRGTAATVAFRLKLIIEQRGLRWIALKDLLVQLVKKTRACFDRKQWSNPNDEMTPITKLRVYLSGLRLYYRSRRVSRHHLVWLFCLTELVRNSVFSVSV